MKDLEKKGNLEVFVSNKKSAVIGYPIKHSLSPILHGYWLEKYSINGSYEKISVSEEDLPDFLSSLAKNGFLGCNITVPHKEIAINFVDDLTPVAKKIEAINTVVVQKDGSLLGDNTDAYGFIENLRSNLSGFDFNNKKVMIIGAGGATKAVIFGLLEAGVGEITIVNRTKEKAEKLSNQFGNKVFVGEWSYKEKYLSDIDLLINTTTLGMLGSHELEIDLSSLPKSSVVTDIVYNPLMTNLLVQAKKQGNIVVDGIGMLLYQAVPGFDYWFGVRPDVTKELKSEILKALK